MTNYKIGEIIWAKIGGYPWWPGKIVRMKRKEKEKQYIINFIGHNSHSILTEKYIKKWNIECKKNRNTRKKQLLEAIKLADILYNENKHSNSSLISETDDLEDKSSIISDKNEEEYEEKEDDEKKADKDINKVCLTNRKRFKKTKTSTNNKIETITKESSESMITILDKTIDKNINKKQEETVKKNTNQSISMVYEYDKMVPKITQICIFEKVKPVLLGVMKEINLEYYSNLNLYKDEILKILKLIKDYKMNDPTEFLKKTELGKIVAYINRYAPEGEIKTYSGEVCKELKEQVIGQFLSYQCNDN